MEDPLFNVWWQFPPSWKYFCNSIASFFNTALVNKSTTDLHALQPEWLLGVPFVFVSWYSPVLKTKEKMCKYPFSRLDYLVLHQFAHPSTFPPSIEEDNKKSSIKMTSITTNEEIGFSVFPSHHFSHSNYRWHIKHSEEKIIVMITIIIFNPSHALTIEIVTSVNDEKWWIMQDTSFNRWNRK